MPNYDCTAKGQGPDPPPDSTATAPATKPQLGGRHSQRGPSAGGALVRKEQRSLPKEKSKAHAVAQLAGTPRRKYGQKPSKRTPNTKDDAESLADNLVRRNQQGKARQHESLATATGPRAHGSKQKEREIRSELTKRAPIISASITPPRRTDRLNMTTRAQRKKSGGPAATTDTSTEAG